MPIIPWLTSEISFPNVQNANPDGVLALGGDLSVDRLILAYKSGIFPWYSDPDPIVWYSPDPRMVLFPCNLQISKSMQRLIKKGNFQIEINKNFNEVLAACQSINRPGQRGTWITSDMKKAYMELNKMGIAKSIEVWMEKELVGGLYGIDLGPVFCGESMFSKRPNASKLAFIHLVQQGIEKPFDLIDCQVYNNHLASLGAEEISRTHFLTYLKSVK